MILVSPSKMNNVLWFRRLQGDKTQDPMNIILLIRLLEVRVGLDTAASDKLTLFAVNLSERQKWSSAFAFDCQSLSQCCLPMAFEVSSAR